jgi:hypothetical protein
MREGNKAYLQEMGAYLVWKERTPVKMVITVTHTETPKEEAAVETVRALVYQ